MTQSTDANFIVSLSEWSKGRRVLYTTSFLVLW